jgi:histone arginine demethylase JMJD6
LIYNKDDSPLYLFESSIESHDDLKSLMKDYEVPKYFREDIFRYVGSDRRPPHRWFLVGPERSGTTIHIDPLGTSAWNASLRGYKLWLLLPPETPGYIAKGKEVLMKNEDDEAIMYFRNIFPRIKLKYGVKEMIFIQKPGDIVFVPGGWWHVVVNLTDTIAVTQNYCNSVNFSKIWTYVRKERRKMAVKLLKELKLRRPDLFNLAIEMNQRDGFVMMTKEEHLLNKKRKNKEKMKHFRDSSDSEYDFSSSSGSSSSSSSSSLDTEDFDY